MESGNFSLRLEINFIFIKLRLEYPRTPNMAVEQNIPDNLLSMFNEEWEQRDNQKRKNRMTG